VTSLPPPPFRAEHLGSLLRPRALKAAHDGLHDGTLGRDDYENVLENEIERAIRMQESVGFRSITDGEFGRSSWFGFFFERMKGFDLKPSEFAFHDGKGNEYRWPTCCAVQRMERTAPICVGEFERVRRLTRQTAKATLPSPSAFHFFRGDRCREVAAYPDLDRWWADLIAVYQAEIHDLAAAGCRYLQIDEVPAAMLCDPDVRARIRTMGYDADQLTEKYIAVVNEVLSVRPAGMTVGMHLCRGNFRSRWMAAGGYDPIAERWFNAIDVDAFYLEYDSDRVGSFEPLGFVGEEKRVVLGLITTKSAALEDPDLLRRRIDEAGRFVPHDRLGLSPQCGFASVAGGNSLTEDEQLRKLGLVVEVAGKVWPGE
jgi:5-methyltetrahydropteroyltriglutamate--homocysteine methyltransferase